VSQLVVDLSSNNAHPLPWDAFVAAGVKGVIIKLIEYSLVDGKNVLYANPDAPGDFAEASARGLGSSGYFFFHPACEVDQIAAALGHAPKGLKLLWQDTEVNDGLAMAQVGLRAKAQLELAPVTPLVGLYSDLSYIAEMAGAPWGNLLWLADPSHPNPSIQCLIHQFGQQTFDGQVVDVNRFLGTDAQFAELFPVLGSVAPTPAPAPAPPQPAPAPPAPSNGGFVPPTVKRGDLSGTVRNAQRLLNVHNANLAVDGSFGPATEQAVKNVQTVFKLAVDGIVGPATWTVLDTFG